MCEGPGQQLCEQSSQRRYEVTVQWGITVALFRGPDASTRGYREQSCESSAATRAILVFFPVMGKAFVNGEWLHTHEGAKGGGAVLPGRHEFSDGCCPPITHCSFFPSSLSGQQSLCLTPADLRRLSSTPSNVQRLPQITVESKGHSTSQKCPIIVSLHRRSPIAGCTIAQHRLVQR